MDDVRDELTNETIGNKRPRFSADCQGHVRTHPEGRCPVDAPHLWADDPVISRLSFLDVAASVPCYYYLHQQSCPAGCCFGHKSAIPCPDHYFGRECFYFPEHCEFSHEPFPDFSVEIACMIARLLPDDRRRAQCFEWIQRHAGKFQLRASHAQRMKIDPENAKVLALADLISKIPCGYVLKGLSCMFCSTSRNGCPFAHGEFPCPQYQFEGKCRLKDCRLSHSSVKNQSSIYWLLMVGMFQNDAFVRQPLAEQLRKLRHQREQLLLNADFTVLFVDLTTEAGKSALVLDNIIQLVERFTRIHTVRFYGLVQDLNAVSASLQLWEHVCHNLIQVHVGESSEQVHVMMALHMGMIAHPSVLHSDRILQSFRKYNFQCMRYILLSTDANVVRALDEVTRSYSIHSTVLSGLKHANNA
jgi:hypothetical protein